MANVNFQAPTDYQIESDELARRREYAKALQAQSLQPSETQTVGGWAIRNSPLQGLGKLAQALAARKGQEAVTADQRALSERYNTERGQALASALRAGQDQPASAQMIGNESPSGAPEGGGPMQIDIPAQKGSRAAMIAELTGSKFPDLQSAGLTQALAENKPFVVGKSLMDASGRLIGSDPTFAAEQEANRIDRGEQLAAKRVEDERKQKADQEFRAQQSEQANDLKVQLAQMSADARRELRQLTASSIPITAVTLQDPDNPNATIVIDGRTRQILGKGPKLTDAGKLENKRQFNMQGIGATIQEAEDILSGKSTGVQPTESGLGSAYDAAGRFFGKSPKGAKEATTLEAVGGALVSKMPRMEGPQSDKDVMLYKEMAGKVGDRTVPIGERQMALEKIKDLWGKYERLNPTAFADRRAGGDAPPPGAVQREQ